MNKNCETQTQNMMQQTCNTEMLNNTNTYVFNQILLTKIYAAV